LTTTNEVLDDSPKASASKSALTFIFFTILVDVIGIGIIIPVIPSLIKFLTGDPLADSARIGGLLIISFAGFQFLFSPVLGELSDRFGRRPVLLFALFGLGIDYLFHAFAPTIGWLFIGRIFAGITGASFTVATAYIADVSTPENKAKNFGLIGAAFGIGFILGPVIGGVCAKFGPQVPFFVAAGLTLLNFIYGFFFIPESLPVERRRKINYIKMIPFVSFAQLGKYKALFGLILAFVLVSLAGQVMPVIWSFFTMEMYKWDEAMVGISLGIVGFLVGLVQAVVIGVMVKNLGSKKVIILGFFFWTTGMILFCFAANQWILFLALIPYVMGGIAGPTMQGMISNSVPANEQGNLQGTMTQLVSLTSIIGPIIYSNVFYKFSSANATVYFPAAPFLVGAIFISIAFIIAIISVRKMKDVAKPEQEEINLNQH
jgi:DHA1 family tetracycline resistance protein-like MFS transporter